MSQDVQQEQKNQDNPVIYDLGVAIGKEASLSSGRKTKLVGFDFEIPATGNADSTSRKWY